MTSSLSIMVVITVATACSAVMPRLRQRKARTQVALRETCDVIRIMHMGYYDDNGNNDEMKMISNNARTQVALRETCVAMIMMEYYDNHNDDDAEDHKL